MRWLILWTVVGALGCGGSARGSGDPGAAAEGTPAGVPADAVRVDVLHYDVALRLDFDRQRVAGEATLTLEPSGGRTVALDAHRLDVESVWMDGAPLWHVAMDDRLFVELPPARAPARLTVRYRAGSGRGLRFSGRSAYTVFHVEDWMPCNAEPADRATATVTLIVPEGLDVMATGEPVERRVREDVTVHRHRLDVEYPAYVLGFAVGAFEERSREVDGVRYRDVSVAHDPAALERILADTPRMMAFFEERSGVEYPLPTFGQAVMDPGYGEEHAGFSLLSREWADSVLEDPSEDWLAAHELAHQWWGNLVTCADWDHFWLNEAFAVLMTAAWKEHRWGREAYERELSLARERWARLRAQGREHALAGDSDRWPGPGADPIPYTKGAAVLGYLRYLLGDEAFWAGVRRYTSGHAGGAATTEDLIAAMQGAPPELWEQWVWGQGAPELAASTSVEGEIARVVLRQGTDPWRLRVPVTVRDADGERTHDLELTGAEHTFELPVSPPVSGVIVDPAGVLPVEVARLDRPTGENVAR